MKSSIPPSLKYLLERRHRAVNYATSLRIKASLKEDSGFELNFDRLENLIKDYKDDNWSLNNSVSTDVCKFVDSVVISDDGCRIMEVLEDFYYDVWDVRGDGNCGYYALALGLVQCGVFPRHIVTENNKMAAVAYKLRSELKVFAINELNNVGNIPLKLQDNCLPDHLLRFVCFDHVHAAENQSKLLHPNISITQYFRDIKNCKDEHLEGYGIFAFAAMYKVTVSVIIHHWDQYTGVVTISTVVFDGMYEKKLSVGRCKFSSNVMQK